MTTDEHDEQQRVDNGEQLLTPLIDLDAVEISALLLGRGDVGLAAAASFINDGLVNYGPVANHIVAASMNNRDNAEPYKVQRNYSGGILRNKIISAAVVELGLRSLYERGIIDEDLVIKNPLISAILDLMTDDRRVILTVSTFANAQKDEFVDIAAPRYGREASEQFVNQPPSNGWSYPVMAFSGVVVMTEFGNIVISPTYGALAESLIFDFQVVAPGPIREHLSELANLGLENVRDGYEGLPITLKATAGFPFFPPISAKAFEKDGGWTTAYQSPIDDVDYQELEKDGQKLQEGLLIAVRKNSSKDTETNRDAYNLLDEDTAIDYVTSISMAQLVQLTKLV